MRYTFLLLYSNPAEWEHNLSARETQTGGLRPIYRCPQDAESSHRPPDGCIPLETATNPVAERRHGSGPTGPLRKRPVVAGEEGGGDWAAILSHRCPESGRAMELGAQMSGPHKGGKVESAPRLWHSL